MQILIQNISYKKYSKYFIKRLYMYIFNIRLLFCRRIRKDLFIGWFNNINKLQYLTILNNVRIGNFARINFYDTFNDCSYNPSLIIGNNAYIGNHFTCLCTDRIIIEDDVLIASYVTITSENHGMNPESEVAYNKQSLSTAPIRICKGVWLGEKVSVLPGVTIGEKSIIGTNSVVTKDIPPYTIAAGIPAKVIKKYNFEKHIWEPVKQC